MAKKVVAVLQKEKTKKMVKIIKMIKSSKTGAYTFSEQIVISSDKIDTALK